MATGAPFSCATGCDEIAERFRASHPEIVGEVNEELFQKYVWIGGTTCGWVPQAWGVDGSP